MSPTLPSTLISLADLDALRDAWESDGLRVAFVPTMGALHEGHLSLVRRARERADRVLVSIFVNPIQFGPSEDFEKYPRTLRSDLELLSRLGVEAVFVPNAAMMYPDGDGCFQTYVHNTTMSQGLCGASRPNHFEGVLTVVLKLFNLVRPHVAVFGKKDYQQWRLIERMAQDLNLRLEVLGAETLREPDGLAMSSRNRYLSPEERSTALRISQGLGAARAKVGAGDRSVAGALEVLHEALRDASLQVEYVELRRRRDLSPFGPDGLLDAPAVLLVAARVGTTRLIDNMELD